MYENEPVLGETRFDITAQSNSEMVYFLYEMRLQEIMVVVFISLDWTFVLMNTTTMIPCRCVV